MKTYPPEVLERARHHLLFLCRQGFRGAWPPAVPTSAYLLELVDLATAQRLYEELRASHEAGSGGGNAA